MADIYNTPKSLEIYKQKLKYSVNISEEDKVTFERFLHRMSIEGIGDKRLLKYHTALHLFLRFRKKPSNDYNTQDLEEFVLWMRGQDIKDPRSNYYAIRKLYAYLEKTEILKSVKVHFRRQHHKLPEELLTKEDVGRIINAAKNLRDRAFIATLYESGCRIAELATRRLKHLQFAQYGAVMTVDGKTGMRRLRLIESVPFIATWMSVHPVKDNPEAPLWVCINNHAKTPDYLTWRVVLERMVARAGIKKRVYFHLFRHSRATELAKHLTEQQMKAYLGWTSGSDMAGIYVHLSGRDVDNAILGMYGQSVQPGKEETLLSTCPRCHQQVHFSAQFCSTCGANMKAIGVTETIC